MFPNRTFTIWFLIFFQITPAFAGREVFPPPINLASTAYILKDYTGTTINSSDITSFYGGRLGSQIIIEITLFNLSNTVQTGTLGLLPGALKAFGGCYYVNGTYFLPKAVVSLCANSNKDIPLVASPYTNVATEQTVNFSIPPQSNIQMRVQLQLEGKYGNSSTSGCPNAYNVFFAPNIHIVVNEDRGAVLGSYVYFHWGLDTYGTYKTCAGTVFNNSHWDGYRENYPPTPIPINGGRPF